MEEKKVVYLVDRRVSEMVFSGTKEEVIRRVRRIYLGF
jgi:hypothetical protein